MSQSIGCNVCGEALPDAEPHVCATRIRFQATEEQWAAMWQVVADVRDAHERSTGDVDSGILLDTLIDSDAFQSIIAAAKAEAWDEGHADGWNDHLASGFSPETTNPYRFEASV